MIFIIQTNLIHINFITNIIILIITILINIMHNNITVIIFIIFNNNLKTVVKLVSQTFPSTILKTVSWIIEAIEINCLKTMKTFSRLCGIWLGDFRNNFKRFNNGRPSPSAASETVELLRTLSFHALCSLLSVHRCQLSQTSSKCSSITIGSLPGYCTRTEKAPVVTNVQNWHGKCPTFLSANDGWTPWFWILLRHVQCGTAPVLPQSGSHLC